MTGIVLMIAGVLLFSSGAFVIRSAKKKEWKNIENQSIEELINVSIADGVLTTKELQIIEKVAKGKGKDPKIVVQKAKKRLSEMEEEAETELVNPSEKKGLDFEKFVIKKFDLDYFNLKEWTGDKFVDGIYAESNLNPDIIFELETKNGTWPLAIECKWRRRFYKGAIEFSTKEQLKRYQNYEKKNSIPVFIVFGIGGKASDPKYLYVVPLRDINKPTITAKELDQYGKNLEKDFFYQYEDKILN